MRPGQRGPCQPQEVPEKPKAGWELSVPMSVPFALQEKVPKEPFLGLGMVMSPPSPDPVPCSPGAPNPPAVLGLSLEICGLGCSKACPSGFSTKAGNHQERELAWEELGILGAWLGS